MPSSDLLGRDKTAGLQAHRQQQLVVWLNWDTRTASFHEEIGFEKMEFGTHDAFMTYLQGLSQKHFRFM